MSDLNQIHMALNRLFNEEGQRIVFWNDPDKEFEEALPQLVLNGVNVLRLDVIGQLATKIRIETEDPTGKYLIYSPTEEPEYEDDWLLDVRLFSRCFRADRASILVQELKLATLNLRLHIADRRKFFDAKDRVQKLKGLVEPDDSAADLDRKMLAVITRAEQPELFNLVRTVFHAWAEADADFDLDVEPGVWEQVVKFDLDGPFWEMVKAAFGYAEENPSLKNLLLRLMLTDFSHHLKGDAPQSLRHLLLPRTGWANAVVCLAQWRDSSSKASSYDVLSAAVAGPNCLNLDVHLSQMEFDELSEVMTFLAVEGRIANSLRERVQSTADTIDAEAVRLVAARRQDGHWASANAADTAVAPRRALHALYDALVAASDFFALRNQHVGGFDYPDASAMYAAYAADLFRFDQLYRHFCEAADTVQQRQPKSDGLKQLRADVEKVYVNWYLTNLAIAWGKFVDPPGGLLGKWQIDKVPNQHQFFDRHVRPWLDEGDNRRAYVVISDAFRYEIAQELEAELNGRYRFEATLTSQFGVLPSYTALGMASLLPHKTLAYKAGTADVLVDGKPSAAGDRDSILQAVGGMACKFDDLMAKKKDEGREFVKEKRVVYVYHNKVDAVGDDAKTEGETFQAVRQAIDDLAAVVSYIVNNLNGHHIVVTADHGFLFAETFPGETDKSKLDKHPDGTVVAKKRYLLGRNLPDHGTTWHGTTAATAGAEGDMEFWVPKGSNRFYFTGGSRFVHGGAMPQEVVVPVLTVKHVRGKSAQDTKTKPVAVQVLGSNHRITTAKHRFELIQMEAVGERVKPVTLKVAVYEDGVAVTNVETVTFDSPSGSLDERKKWVSLTLQDRPYSKKTRYRLTLRDADSEYEYQAIDIVIDRTFTDDF